MPARPPDAATASAAPDWAAIHEDVLCPLCDYNLRGLIEPRCPECGYRFDWPEVLDPRRRLHRYLFEHHPERNVKSFFQTAAGTWRPKRFWTSLHPAQPSHPKRLVAYWCISVALFVLILALSFAGLVLKEALRETNLLRQMRAGRAAQLRLDPEFAKRAGIGVQYASIEEYLDTWHPVASLWDTFRDTIPYGYGDSFLFTVTMVLIWPWLSFLALMVFSISMRRARIRPIHVLRCALYACDSVPWLGLAFLVIAFVKLVLPGGGRASITNSIELDGSLLISVMIIVGLHRLWRAYKGYLRFDHPFWTVLASQIIVILFVPTVVTALAVLLS